MKKKLNIILAIFAISFLQGLQFAVVPVLGKIQDHYSEISTSMIQMLVTAPTLLSVVVALISGALVLKISKKKLLLFAALLAGVIGFIPLFVDNFWILFASRVIYGAALGLAMTLNTAVVAEFFEGDERVTAMGIQAASVGCGMVVNNFLGGVLGAANFTHAYYLYIIGFISFVVLLVFLPDTGVAGGSEKGEKVSIKLNGKVYMICLLGFLENIFLITFSTNIAMHVAGDASISGILTSVFSASQIVVGIILGNITKITKKFTLPVAMLSFAVGAFILVVCPTNMVMLAVGAIFCGFSQGMFIPTAMVEVSNAVAPIATAMAAAALSCMMNLGQFISPTIVNTCSKVVTGSVSTSGVYMIAVGGMIISAIIAAVYKKSEK